MKKITRDEALKIVKKRVKWYYTNILGKPFIRRDFDNHHLEPFRTNKKVILEAPCLKAYRGLWFARRRD